MGILTIPQGRSIELLLCLYPLNIHETFRHGLWSSSGHRVHLWTVSTNFVPTFSNSPTNSCRYASFFPVLMYTLICTSNHASVGKWRSRTSCNSLGYNIAVSLEKTYSNGKLGLIFPIVITIVVFEAVWLQQFFGLYPLVSKNSSGKWEWGTAK